jgi:hypothetical protein
MLDILEEWQYNGIWKLIYLLICEEASNFRMQNAVKLFEAKSEI